MKIVQHTYPTHFPKQIITVAFNIVREGWPNSNWEKYLAVEYPNKKYIRCFEIFNEAVCGHQRIVIVKGQMQDYWVEKKTHTKLSKFQFRQTASKSKSFPVSHVLCLRPN